MKNTDLCYVYMHINKINSKKYIGITKDIKRRWQNNGREYKGFTFGYAIEKYGWDNFDHIILFENLTREEACKKEIELIAYYNTTDNAYGYNISKGGDGVYKDFRKIYQYSLDGKFIKEHISIEEIVEELNLKHVKNVYACCNGKRSSAYGYRWFYEYQGEVIDALIDRFERTAKSRRIKVYQYSLDGKFIKEYQSSEEVRKELNVYIDPCLRGITCSAGGFQWFYDYKGEFIDKIKSTNEKLGERQSKQVYMYDKNGIIVKIFDKCKDVCEYFNTYHKKIKQVIDNHTLFNGFYLSYENIND